jgi:flagellar assembly protein FliH
MHLSNAIPKEQQTAYERWELASFGDTRASTVKQVKEEFTHSAITKLVNEQIAAKREEARQAGYAEGHAQGHAAGLAAGRTEATQETNHLRQIAESFGNAVAHANDAIAQDLLNLALDIAQAMLKTSLDIKPELVLPVISEAIRYLPNVQQPAALYLHPQDTNIVRQHMGAELEKSGWRIAEDMNVTRGGCRVETASNQIDASIETRWQRIAEALGKESNWLNT